MDQNGKRFALTFCVWLAALAAFYLIYLVVALWKVEI